MTTTDEEPDMGSTGRGTGGKPASPQVDKQASPQADASPAPRKPAAAKAKKATGGE